jgi:hypothetical protein
MAVKLQERSRPVFLHNPPSCPTNVIDEVFVKHRYTPDVSTFYASTVEFGWVRGIFNDI